MSLLKEIKILPVYYSKLKSHERSRVRRKYILKQDNKCMYCGNSLSDDPPEEITNKKINWKLFPANFLKYPIHLHHNHDTDLTEGVVHSYCNAVLWQYEGK